MFFVCPSLQHFIGAFLLFLTRSKSQLMVCSHTAEPGSVQQVEMCPLKEHKFAILDVQVTACSVCERSREMQCCFGGLSFPGSLIKAVIDLSNLGVLGWLK